MSFRFRYDRLLEYREQLFEREQQELSRIVQLAKTIEEECNRLVIEHYKCAEAFASRQREGISADEWLFFSENLEGLELLEEQRQKLLEARKQVETLKVLRDQEREDHRRKKHREEQKESDETALVKTNGVSHEV